MRFSKRIFKEHYGKPYISRVKYTLIADVISLCSVVILLSAGLTIPAPLAFLLLGILVLSVFVLPLFLSYYVKALKMSQRQKQWFKDGILHVLIVPEDGFTWGAITTNTKEYIFAEISSITLSQRYIEIHGNIQLIEKYNESIEEKNVSVCKIPRNFEHEDKITRIGGINYAN